MKRLLVPLVALCVVVPAVALAADTDPKKRIDPADQAKARAVVLKRTDLGAGWKTVPPSPEESEPTCPGYDPDSSDLTLTGQAEADFERRGGATVSSSVEVFISRSDALKSWSRAATPGLPRCLASTLRKSVEEDGGKATIVKQGRIAFPRTAPRSVAFRVGARLTLEQQGKPPVHVPITIHLVGVGRGRADATLFTSGLGTGIPIGELRALARVLSMRLANAGF